MFDWQTYRIEDASNLLTPCLMVYPAIVRQNIAEMIRIAGSADRLRPHCKTHKTRRIIDLQMASGIKRHKCATLCEAKLLAECGVPDVLIAYPQVEANLQFLAAMMREHTQTRFSIVVDNSQAIRAASRIIRSRGLTVDVLLDIDTGMHRTGVAATSLAEQLYREVEESEGLTAVGLHVYDGQNHQPELAERQQAVQQVLSSIKPLVELLENQMNEPPRIVVGGTPTFPVFASADFSWTNSIIEFSPGTCVLSDYNYGSDYSDMACMQPAAVLLTRVISKPGADRLTLDLGYKAIASDPPAGQRVHLLNVADAKEVIHSEEHLVVETAAASEFSFGDLVYALPAHICPTVNLHHQMQVVQNGLVTTSWEIIANKRLYHVS